MRFSKPIPAASALVLMASLPFTTAKIKVMPLGDSITEWGCWRSYLWNSLGEQTTQNLEFIGTNSNWPVDNCPGSIYDMRNEGHHSKTSGEMARLLPFLLEQNVRLNNGVPDIVMMHLGTNDVAQKVPTFATVQALDSIVDTLRERNPNVIVLVAKIIPLKDDNRQSLVLKLNAAIEPWAQQKDTLQSPVLVVDQYTGFDTRTDSYDGCHPTENGDTKIAKNWQPALEEAIHFVTRRTTRYERPMGVPIEVILDEEVGGSGSANRIRLGKLCIRLSVLFFVFATLL
ncbi:SGNH hydrolase [Ascobolus immersus RN42]|uniref:SGNH hydrolase n=1 Tax=Ascobolus immersus RN42 TaxID=1160509 RepID=A0A3N4I2V6_ASCIM|nr:SGNH hydrolase [Ascobolus immersus RN42]